MTTTPPCGTPHRCHRRSTAAVCRLAGVPNKHQLPRPARAAIPATQTPHRCLHADPAHGHARQHGSPANTRQTRGALTGSVRVAPLPPRVPSGAWHVVQLKGEFRARPPALKGPTSRPALVLTVGWLFGIQNKREARE